MSKKISLFNSPLKADFNEKDYSQKWYDEDSGVTYFSYFDSNKPESIKSFVNMEKKLLKSFHDNLYIAYEESEGKSNTQIKEIVRNRLGSYSCDYPTYDNEGFIVESINNWSKKEGLRQFIYKNGKFLYKALDSKIPFLHIEF